MKTRQFPPNHQEPSCIDATRTKFAMEFLSGLTDKPRITDQQLEDLSEIAKQVYPTTFTDDSDYMPGAMDFSALNTFPPELREELLTYFSSKGNYIVKQHVQDYKNYLENCVS